MDEIKKWNSNALELFVALLTIDDPVGVQKRIDDVKRILRNLMTMIHELCKQSESCDDIGELMEKELGTMDKAIEEAAARIEVNYARGDDRSPIGSTMQHFLFCRDMFPCRKCCPSRRHPIRASSWR